MVWTFSYVGVALPGGCPPSIFGTDELNCRVRDGNGWTLIAIDTDWCVPCGTLYSITDEFTQCKHFFYFF